MDYEHPDGAKFSLALIRRKADNTSKDGTLFWNPGGPSDAGTAYLPAAIGGFPAEVRKRYDIVSWDPRGMGGRTTPVVQCFESAAAEERFMAGAPRASLPVTERQMTEFVSFQSRLNQSCVEHGGGLLEHVSTADNARDLDLLRQAVGDEKLTYYGTSYGTFLGATYLNMFPDKVRAAVLDGAVFPTAWIPPASSAARTPAQSTFLRAGSDHGMEATFEQFLTQCGLAGPEACPFAAGSPEQTHKKWNELLRRATANPVKLDGGETADGLALLGTAQSSLYLIRPLSGFDRFPGWAGAAAVLQKAWTASGGTATPTSSTASFSGSSPRLSPDEPSSSGVSAPEAAGYTTSVGRQRAVICGESPNPRGAAAYAEQARKSYARAGTTPWPWAAVCEGWTARAADPYTGPWDRSADTPVLVVGNTFDPATAYSSSRTTARELPGSRLLTVDGYGHTELLNPSGCAQRHIAAYYVDGTLPAEGTRCAQDVKPFGK
ncbi:alpha/beta hydrolase [Streptomyces bambusae]|uniref:alpha/beta hydrolase n=1 Tax=Streptomyces bambusae TaxID=1550616 RepID=UPI001CFC5E60|nr:alpha/beta hydrolase [Streptomyces bambusae]MCB5167358.1 alpha/beta hydrolase [Streptomyces bambusae]